MAFRNVSDAAARLRHDVQAMRDALDRLGSDAAVSDAYGVSESTVNRWRTAHRLPPATGLTAAQSSLRDDAVAMQAALDTHGCDRAVAEAFGVAKGTVRNWRRAHGLAAAGDDVQVPDEAVRMRNDRGLLVVALAEHGSDAAVADAVGVSPAAVHRWRVRHDVPAFHGRPSDIAPAARIAYDRSESGSDSSAEAA